MRVRMCVLTLKAPAACHHSQVARAEAVMGSLSGGVGPAHRTKLRGTGPSVPHVLGVEGTRPAETSLPLNVTRAQSVRVGKAREAKRARAGPTILPSRECLPSLPRPMRVMEMLVPHGLLLRLRRIRRFRRSSLMERPKVGTALRFALGCSSRAFAGRLWPLSKGMDRFRKRLHCCSRSWIGLCRCKARLRVRVEAPRRKDLPGPERDVAGSCLASLKYRGARIN